MTEHLWDELVQEIQMENHQEMYDQAVQEVKDDEYMIIHDDAIGQCMDQMDEKVAGSRLLGTKMLVAALSRVIDAPLSEQQKRHLRSEVEQMVDMVRPIAHDIMNGMRYMSERAMREAFIEQKLAELPLSTARDLTEMADAIEGAISEDDEFP